MKEGVEELSEECKKKKKRRINFFWKKTWKEEKGVLK